MGWTRNHFRDRDRSIFTGLAVAALFFPVFAQLVTGGSGGALVNEAADAGVFVLLALGLNIVVGMAGLLDLGYAAFFAIGAYTYGMLASGQLALSPIHHAVHLPFWLLLFVGVVAAAFFGVVLGAPTLRLRGDYLAIVTLGFGEIVPRVFRNLKDYTGGVNAISAIDQPVSPLWLDGPWNDNHPLNLIRNFNFAFNPYPFYVTMCLLVVLCIILVRNLQVSRLGRAWMAVREDEVAAAATGVNTVAAKLMAFALGASFSGFAGVYYGAKLSLVSPDAFSFVVSVTILVMVVLGGMGNITGVILGALLIYFVQFKVLIDLPDVARNFASSVGLGVLNQPHGDWVGLHDEVQRLNFLIFGLILVVVMLLRPQGLIPSRVREQELQKGTAEDAVFDLRES